MPDWQSELGLQMIYDRDIQYAKLMVMFGMQNLLIDVLSSINTPNKHQILEVLNLETTNYSLAKK